jgi:hypothetical protein
MCEDRTDTLFLFFRNFFLFFEDRFDYLLFFGYLFRVLSRTIVLVDVTFLVAGYNDRFWFHVHDPLLDFGGVGGEELVEETADQLIYVGLQYRDRRLFFIFKFVVFEVDGSLLYFLFLLLDVRLVIQHRDFFIELQYALLVNHIILLRVD